MSDSFPSLDEYIENRESLEEGLFAVDDAMDQLDTFDQEHNPVEDNDTYFAPERQHANNTRKALKFLATSALIGVAYQGDTVVEPVEPIKPLALENSVSFRFDSLTTDMATIGAELDVEFVMPEADVLSEVARLSNQAELYSNEQELYTWMPEVVTQWQDMAGTAEEEAGFPDEYRGLLLAIIATETVGDPAAVSGLGAEGLTQIMPELHAALLEKYEREDDASLDLENTSTQYELEDGELLDPEYNLYVSASFLAWEVIPRVEGYAADATIEERIRLVAAEYHSGPDAARRVFDGGQIGPHGEQYMDRVGDVFNARNDAESNAYDWPFEAQ